MKEATLLLTLLLFCNLISPGQITALFVGDESENQQNASQVYQILKNSLPAMEMFNAVDSARSPMTSEMSPYQLVVWYCGSDARDLYFWLGTKQVNTELVNYLDGGGKLWLMGSGFLNDRFMTTPIVFSSPLFVYDYLGIYQWFLETYTDDGGNGVPQLELSDDNPIFTLSGETLSWSEPPEPWVDGCMATDQTVGVYEFGPSTYLFNGFLSAFYCTAGEMNNLVFTFDPARLEQEQFSSLSAEVLLFYDDLLDIGEGTAREEKVVIYPVPAASTIYLQTGLKGNLVVNVIDLTGKKLMTFQLYNAGNSSGNTEIPVADLPGGFYFLRVDNGQQVFTSSFAVSR